MATGGGKLNNLPESAVERTCGMGEVERKHSGIPECLRLRRQHTGRLGNT